MRQKKQCRRGMKNGTLVCAKSQCSKITNGKQKNRTEHNN